jgi:hypothetical protein
MEQKINNQLEIIENSNKWVLETKSMEGAKGKNAYRNLVNCRRKLNKKKFALEGNPAAAMFGQSQVGKSYLIDALLSEQSKPFGIVDKDGVVYGFKKDMNPQGGGSESTSLVSRFSTRYTLVNPKFPVKAKLLSPADLVLVLCDSYYNDIKGSRDTMLQRENIDDAIIEFKNKWQERTVQQKVFTEDDVLDIQEYIYENFSTKAGNLSTFFFEEISLLIAKVKPTEWSEVFSLLWNKNEKFTSLFSSLISKYEILNFTDTLYLPIEAVLYKHGTLLDVTRMREIYESPKKIETAYKADTNILLVENNQEREIESFPKSYLCALSAELVFSLPATLLASKPFLKETDLLDFPGSRARKTTPENDIAETAMSEFLIRGKVAYLFNKYSNFEKINILLFCAKHEQPSERAMPEILDPLINKIIGDSPESREEFLKKSQIPPLFIIGTFFNVNLEYSLAKDSKDDISSLTYRWNQRFERSLEELIDTKTYTWFKNWTVSQPNFQNIFLLRDFEHSTQIFEGYSKESPVEMRKKSDPGDYPDFSEKLRQSFIDYDFVKKHFENPANSWDRAASINEDGAQLIIDKLIIAANNINYARLEKIKWELNTIGQIILDELKKYYHDSDSDARLQKARSTAGSVQANLDIAFGQNPYFFGQMMKEFMLSESAVYKLYLGKIRDIERRDVVNMDKYSAIRMNVSELNPNDSFDINLERLRLHYEKPTKEECKAYFEGMGIDLEELFCGNNERVKNFSQVLSDELETYWFEQYMQANRQNLSKIFSESGLQDIQDMLRRLFKKLRISEVIAGKIRAYVDGYRNIEDAYEMIADISAEIINKFINTIGMEYLTESELVDLKQANENNSLGLILEHNELQFEQNTPAEAADLITKMGNLPELLNQNPLPQAARRLPNYRSYIMWYDLLKVGFVSVCDIPNYDIQANKKLQVIIDQCRTIKY